MDFKIIPSFFKIHIEGVWHNECFSFEDNFGNRDYNDLK